MSKNKNVYGNRKTPVKKDEYIRARVTKYEKGLIANHALLKGFNVSEYIMDLIIKDMEGKI